MSLINEPINECLVCRCPLYHTEHQKAYLCEIHIDQAETYYDQETLLIPLFEREPAWAMALKHASSRLKDDEKLVSIAVGQNWKAIEFASERLKKHPNLIRLAEKQCADAFDYYATIDLKIRRSLIKYLQLLGVIFVILLSLGLQKMAKEEEIRLLQESIRLAQIEEQKQAQIKEKIRQEQELQKAKEAEKAIIKARLFEAKKNQLYERTDIGTLNNAKNTYGWPISAYYVYNRAELIEEAKEKCNPLEGGKEISKKHHLYQEIKQQCLKVLRQDASMFIFVANVFKDDQEIVTKCSQQVPFVIQHASMRLRNNLSFILKLLKMNHFVYNHLPLTLKQEPKVLAIFEKTDHFK